MSESRKSNQKALLFYSVSSVEKKKTVRVLGCYDIVEKNHELNLLLEGYFQGKYVEILILA